jgi:ABC-2 type transport system permease protein
MIRSFKAELLKLRRPAVLWGAAGAMLGFGLLATILSFATATRATTAAASPVGGVALGSTIGQLSQPGGLTRGFSVAAGFIGLLVFVLFTTNMTSDYGLGTIRVLLTRQPRRARLLAGKLVALLAFVAVLLLAAELVSAAVAIALAHCRDVSTAKWLTADGLRHLGGDYANAVLTSAVFGTVGISLGVFTRSTRSRWASGWPGWARSNTSSSSAGAEPRDGSRGWSLTRFASGGTAITTYQRAVVTAVAYAGLALSIAVLSFVRRDVSV